METAKAAARARANAKRKASRAVRTPALDLTVQYATASRGVPTCEEFRSWAGSALDHDAQITVRVVGLEEGRELNRTYRGADHATNVLTFVLSDTPPLRGDLALCAPVVTREAREQRKDLTAHYAHLTVHGVLHLQGYDHDTDREAAAMERRETRILKRLGYPDPYSPLLHHG
jgi:probable rRNA maturation factor